MYPCGSDYMAFPSSDRWTVEEGEEGKVDDEENAEKSVGESSGQREQRHATGKKTSKKGKNSSRKKTSGHKITILCAVS